MPYQVKLDVFEGPLDLLLHLIKKNEVDIYDIPIAAITEQYMEYLKLMKTLNLDIAGEFLVMAATLIYIKSRILLPSTAGEEDDQEDPRAQLVKQLLEYQRFKNAAQQLREYESQREEVFSRQALPLEELEDISSEEGCLEVSLFELLLCFKKVMAQAGQAGYYEISTPDDTSIEQQTELIMNKLLIHQKLNFEDLFDDKHTKLEMIVTFLALLELIRHQQVIVHQPVPLGHILICVAPQAQPHKTSD
jgi:segregation and condensation protein A